MADIAQNTFDSSALTALETLTEIMLSSARSQRNSAFTPAEIKSFSQRLHEWSETISASETAVRFISDEGQNCLEAVGPDKPFLVDSLLGACARLETEVVALFHPIIEMGDGSNRSLIQIHLSPLTDQEEAMLVREARATLKDVDLATSDYRAMRARMSVEAERLAACRHISDAHKTEALAFLNWLGDEHFVFLGVRDYAFNTDEDGAVLPDEPNMVEGSNLGLLRDENRNVLNRGSEPLLLDEEIGRFLSEPEPLILAKATMQSRVHRNAVCDYVGVKHFDENGNVNGETRFLGLYTSEAYNNSVRDVPLIRKRVAKVIESSGALKGSYNAKALANIMESWPRDELIQTDSETLLPMMLGALQLGGWPSVHVFARYDRFRRFVSMIVFVPRESYDTRLRERITDLLEDAFKGRLARFEPRFDGASLVRVLFEISLPTNGPEPDIKTLETEIKQLARTWRDRFRSKLMVSDLDAEARSHAAVLTGAFNAAYREAFEPEEAMRDVEMLAELSPDRPVILRAFRLEGDDDGRIRAKIYARNGAIPLSDCVPVFEQMGLFVARETGYPVSPQDKPVANAPGTYWIHSLEMRRSDRRDIALDKVCKNFENGFAAIWNGRAENDGFNALIFNAGLTWREAALCRTLCAYRHQTGLDPAKETQIESLNTNPVLATALVKLFSRRFDPEAFASRSERETALQTAYSNIQEGLKAVTSLDHDRVIRRVCDLILATQRTNFYQTDASGEPGNCISLKVASRELADLPEPKPYREIFMSSPQVEGVHCRFGPVARGGLRWSDRRDDFRTEVLGLVKAQQVKNSVIVPVGSKGGFFPKKLPVGGSREEVREAGIAAYQTFITTLLGLTDNLVKGEVQHPAQTEIWDGEDPYLVVAADKGTATFSDIANEISQLNGFWLGDAFASGGSAGYDHKKMGITARGAWEAVKRHFREIGHDIQTEPFTVIGCGDMSGDVFGNGMLLSKQIRLQAAFNHQHIFIDPNPQDPERLWQERQRLFDLHRSSWTDYNTELLSEGGAIFDRHSKALELSPQVKALTGLTQDTVTPDELIHALLKSKCDLLWFGGIGTYIKASSETDMDAGDRSNDSIRVNGKQVGAKVIGEGANLGLTQAGRIEFALAGGRINTDAIDNSAGVDSSDHEVNIKILCTEAIAQGALKSGERNTLLASMTDDVAMHVLAHNYDQTAALSLAEHGAKENHDAFERLMTSLEGRGVLDRDVEGLPSTAEMASRPSEKKYLTRPEIAVLMAWSKIVLFDDLVNSDLPDDTYFADTANRYFPKSLRTYEEAIASHRLRREIIATVLANRIIDYCGPVFFLRLSEQSGVAPHAIVSAFEAACTLLRADDLLDAINNLDNKVPAKSQIALRETLRDSLGALTQGLIAQTSLAGIAEQVLGLSSVADALRNALPESLTSFERNRLNKRIKTLSVDGVPKEVAEAVAITGWLVETPEIAAMSVRVERPAAAVFSDVQSISEALGFSRLSASAHSVLKSMPHWDRLATHRLLGELTHMKFETAFTALSKDGADIWLAACAEESRTLRSSIKTLTTNRPSFAQLSLAANTIRSFATKV
ncbi:MAG: NAD-glutamate dehydrogenase [Henriciella sp.]